jgi:hypothetical protein
MADLSILPFDIGSTAGVTGSTDKQELEGKWYFVEDRNYGTTPNVPRAYYGQHGGMMYKKVRVVRNVSGVAILPRQLCTFVSTVYPMQVDGLACVTAMEAFPADEFLPAAGVKNNDLFYIVEEGPAELLTDLAAGANNLLVASTGGANSWLVALTAATSQCTTAGRVAPQSTSGATTALAQQIMGRIGLCLSSMTTAQTNAAVLAYIKKW